MKNHCISTHRRKRSPQQDTARRSTTRRLAAAWEPLERRDLMTATFSLSAGHLQVFADAAGGSIQVQDTDHRN